MNDDDLYTEIASNFERCQNWESRFRNHYVDDLKFGNGDAYNLWQWPQKVQDARNAPGAEKPMLTVNKTQQHCLQIINDARQNKVGVQVRPVGGEATEQSANIIEGVVRHIEYRSNATLAYEAAMYTAVFGGIGYVRVHVDYCDEDSFDQDIFIKRVADPLTVFLDPDIEEYDGSDARFGFVFEDLPRKEAEKKYHKNKEAFEDPGINGDSWYGDDHVRVCEYFWRTEVKDKLVRLPNGKTVRKSEMPDGMYDFEKQQVEAIGEKLIERDIVDQRVKWCKVIGKTIVEKKDWLGKYIPIARLVGQELVVQGQLDRWGHVRALLDPQRMYNYHSAGSVEFVALQTKTPWLTAARAIDGQVEQWTDSNVKNAAVLVWNDVGDDGQPVAKPERIMPPPPASGHIEGMQVAQQELMMASGQYQAVMGAPSNETSGKAINARQRQGDNATYHFVDHQAVMIRFVGRIILDLIPKIYDTQRVITVLGRSDERMKVQVDPQFPGAANQQKTPDDDDFNPEEVAAIFNPKVGKYDVISDVGPSYGTQRQEAFNAFSQIMAQNKEAFTIVGDLWAESADFPGSEKLAKRLANMVPAQAKGGPSPELQQAQQQLQTLGQKAAEEIDRLTAELEKTKADAAVKEYEAETKRMAAVGNIDPEALKPVIRTMISEMIGQPIVPLMQEHAQADQAMQPAPEPPMQGMPNGL